MSGNPNQEEALFVEALALPVVERAAFLDRACGDDPSLRARLAALLAAHDAPETVLGAPAIRSILRPNEQPGTRIGRYLLMEKIGEGGCGAVYLAEQQEPVRRRVALKVIKLGMDSVDVVARFEAERQALALMDHPNIANVLDAGATETGRPYFVMELVTGTRITAYCDEHDRSLPDRLKLFMQVCYATQHAHQKGIIHRDLKPSNILVTDLDGVPVPKVIDFGIAKATQGHLTDRTVLTAIAQFVGTPVYMSPEQAEFSGRDIDTRSDIYSLGVLLYELVAGRPPFDPEVLLESGLDEIRRQIREVEPPRPSTRLSTLTEADRTTIAQRRNTDAGRLSTLLRNDLDWIVMKCLEKDRARRYDTANGLAGDVQRYLSHEPVTASPPSTVYRLRKTIARHKVLFAAAALVALSLLAGTVVSTWQAVRAVRAERLATARLQGELTARQDADTQRKLAENRLTSTQAAQQEADRARAHADEQRRFADEQRIRAEASLKAESAALRESKQQKAVAEQERLRALAAEKAAQTEAAISEAVNRFLQDDLLRQADSRAQSDLLVTPDPNLRVRDALDRAATRVKNRFQNQPLVEAGIRDTIGRTYLGLGELDQAVSQLERALELTKSELGSDDAKTLTAMQILGDAYSRQRRLPEASSLLASTLEGCRRILGDEHPLTLATANSLAATWRSQGRPREAMALLEPSYAIGKRVLGPDHTQSLMAANILAGLYFDQGKLAEAASAYRELCLARERLLSPTHPDLLTTKHNLAHLYLTQGDTANAALLIRDVWERRKSVLGPQHTETLASMNELASVLRAQSRLEESASLLDQTIALRRQVIGPEHPDTLVSLSNLACTYWAQHRRAEATALFAEVAETEKRVQGPDHPDTLCSLESLAGAYAKTNRLDDAAGIYGQLLAARRQKFGPSHLETIHTARNLGVVHLRRRDFAAAEPLLLVWSYQQLLTNNVEDDWGDQVPAEPGALANLMGLLFTLYTNWGRADEAQLWRERYRAMFSPVVGQSTQDFRNSDARRAETWPRSSLTGSQQSRPTGASVGRAITTPTNPTAPAPNTPVASTVKPQRPTIPFHPTPPEGSRRPGPGIGSPPSSGGVSRPVPPPSAGSPSPRPPGPSSPGSSGSRGSSPGSSSGSRSSGSSGSSGSSATGPGGPH